MRRVWVSVEPRGFWAVQRNMEPLSSAGTLSRTSSLPLCSSLPSSKCPPTLVQVYIGSGNTSLYGNTGKLVKKSRAWSQSAVREFCFFSGESFGLDVSSSWLGVDCFYPSKTLHSFKTLTASFLSIVPDDHQSQN